jgi:hypothetical protein
MYFGNRCGTRAAASFLWEDQMIKQYRNQVFTNDGNCTVAQFMGKLDQAEDDLKRVDRLLVYTGFHGDAQGNFDKRFSAEEAKTASAMGSMYSNKDRIETLDRVLSDDEIIVAVTRGRVLFTWCNSDAKVTGVMARKGQPLTFVKDYPVPADD